jgi:seryl-tRNA synthetase
MIDPKLLRNNIEAVNAALAKRGVQLNAQNGHLEVRRKEFSQKLKIYKQNVMRVLNKLVKSKSRWRCL